jgi:hypothetical protein
MPSPYPISVTVHEASIVRIPIRYPVQVPVQVPFQVPVQVPVPWPQPPQQNALPPAMSSNTNSPLEKVFDRLFVPILDKLDHRAVVTQSDSPAPVPTAKCNQSPLTILSSMLITLSPWTVAAAPIPKHDPESSVATSTLTYSTMTTTVPSATSLVVEHVATSTYSETTTSTTLAQQDVAWAFKPAPEQASTSSTSAFLLDKNQLNLLYELLK